MYSLEYRPFKLIEMMGHKKILKEFKKRSLDYDFPEVMIFSGETGTGKTTLACIVAGILNCTDPLRAENEIKPCGECLSCKSILNEKFNRDILFYDGSSMGKPEVEKLKERVEMSPLFDKKKIIIIDEAQNLASSAAKGATLKLLEKKRKDVYFILCTMDQSKIHKAILDRGQVYKFKPLDAQDIGIYLIRVLKKINEEIPESFYSKGMLAIAENSEGSLRKALQYLERCVKGEIYNEDEILDEFGIYSEDKIYSLINRLLSIDSKVLFEINQNKDIVMFYNYTRKLLSDAIIYKISRTVDQPWKEKNAQIFSSHKTLESLYEAYMNVPNWSFDKNLFMWELFKYFDKNKQKKLTRIPI